MNARGGNGSGGRGVLTRPTGEQWPEGVLQHGARVAVLLAVGVLLTLLFPPERRLEVSRGWTVGTVADEDVVARMAFEVPESPEALEQRRADARASTPPTFDSRPEASEAMAADLEAFFEQVDSALAREDPAVLARVLDDRSIPLTADQRLLLREPPTFQAIRQAALRGARDILPQGVADGAQLRDLGTDQITVREGDTDRSVSRDEVMTASEFRERVLDLLPVGTNPGVQETLRLLLIQFTDYTLELNVQATSTAQERAAQAVPEDAREVLRDQVIVRSGDPITEQDLRALETYETELRTAGLLEDDSRDPRPVLGAWLLNVVLLGLVGLLLFFYRREIYANVRWMVLIAVLVVAFFGMAAVISTYALSYELLPIAFVTLVVAVLFDSRIALLMAAVLSVAVAAQPAFEPEAVSVVATTLVGGAAAAMSVRAVRRRVQAWVFGALIAGGYMLVIAALTLLGTKAAADLGPSLAYAGGNAFLSAILAMGFIPVFEWFTGITTDQTLLEWADPNRPLLERLSLEAPGTYAHTINVANLAEAAAGEIGADGLLCRVGLYYHDVGKMLKPHYFVENQPQGRNPHEKLKPQMSAAIVREHVTGGLELAREAGVPDVVAAFIPEHHGDQRISFFWEKALEEQDEEELNPDDFRYPGPRPRSRETAIAMLADSVESATRALQDPTDDRVRSLIDSIVDAKIADGQLDDAPLTLGEVSRIKEQFAKRLTSIHHHRIDYPTTKHLTEAPREMGGDAPSDLDGEEDRRGDDGGSGEGEGPEAREASGVSGHSGPARERPEG